MAKPKPASAPQAEDPALRRQSRAERAGQCEMGPVLELDCGCKVEIYNFHGIQVSYCERHSEFIFSPRYDGLTDIFYFVTEDKMP